LLFLLLLIANILASVLITVMVSNPALEINSVAATIFGTQLPEEFPLIFRVAMITALPLGALQFSVWIFRRKKQLHFLIGNIYVLLCLFLASPLLLALSLSHTDPVLLIVGSSLSIYWWRCTRLSVRLVAEGDLTGHAKWMFRSYAAMLAGALLGTMLFYAGSTLHKYAVIPVLLLIGIVPEILLRRGQHKSMLRNFLSSN